MTTVLVGILAGIVGTAVGFVFGVRLTWRFVQHFQEQGESDPWAEAQREQAPWQ